MPEKLQNTSAVLGAMSGTSLDGLDLALCEFECSNGVYSFKIIKAETVAYAKNWAETLTAAPAMSALQYAAANSNYGRLIASEINKFLQQSPKKPMAVASHGHTVFHQPQMGFSTQIGCGATIAANTGITSVCDFRSLDVARGGQGAPLVPVGDKLLFGNYEACLNIGGIANISFDNDKNERVAYDICEANMLLNYLAQKQGRAFDENGGLARSGTVNGELLKQLNAQDFYNLKGAKSIGREWFEKQVLSLFESKSFYNNDLLATATVHVAQVIANELTAKKIKNVLITGGGAWNTFLIEQIRSTCNCELIIPNAETVNFKEALVFAFLGYLRLQEKINTLKSVTGAAIDSIGGAVYLV